MPSADTKAARRAKAAAFREAEERRSRRKKITVGAGIGAGTLVLIGVGAFAVTAAIGSVKPAPLPTPRAATGSSLPPWAAPADPTPFVRAAGLAMGTSEGTATHFHPHLDIIINGQSVPVAADIGIDTRAGALSELHTHDASGILHVESPARNDRYVLGQLFSEWNVRLDRTHLGGLSAGGGKALSAYVDGKRVSGDPAEIELVSHREIALIFGGASDHVKIPQRYSFPSGV